jgi:hypothetical protein
MALPKDKRQTAEQAAAFAKKALQQNEFHRSRRDPDQKFRRDPFEKVMGWLLPRAGKSRSYDSNRHSIREQPLGQKNWTVRRCSSHHVRVRDAAMWAARSPNLNPVDFDSPVGR